MSALAKIHVARKQLALEEDSYRAILERTTGKSSAAAMSEAERGRVLAEFERLGFRAQPGRKGRPPHVKKIYALWGELQSRGAVVSGPRGAAALRAFVRRQTGASAPEFLPPDKAASVTEALKSWIDRVKKGSV
jgi:hypothetical protein